MLVALVILVVSVLVLVMMLVVVAVVLVMLVVAVVELMVVVVRGERERWASELAVVLLLHVALGPYQSHLKLAKTS